MKAFFSDLFAYNHRCNQLLVDACCQAGSALPYQAEKLLNHVLNAHQIWNHRIAPEAKAFGVWEMHAREELAQIDSQNLTRTTFLLEEINLTEVINYTNSQKQAFRSTVRDILFHIINHSTYHRGQMATLFRQEGLEPLVTDYIFLQRSQPGLL